MTNSRRGDGIIVADHHLSLVDPIATFTPNIAKSRFGVVYVRAVCCQAGVGFTEVSVDEDVLAIDATIDFVSAPAAVQIKCTGQFKIRGGTSATWPAEVAWRELWRHRVLPIYFVLVIVAPDQSRWLDHHDEGTLQRAAAFWVRVDPRSEASGITVPKDQRFTADTLREWAADVQTCFLIRDGGDDGAH